MPRAHALSYVIPARDAGVTLSKTLESLRAQSTPHWRAVVVDDGSTDDTPSIAEATSDPRITTIRTPPQGVARARETGVDALPHDNSPICFLDADDWVEPEHATLLLDAIEGHDAVACGYAMVDADGADLDFRRSPSQSDCSLNRQIECNRFLIGCVALSRSIVERVRSQFGSLFDASLQCEDWDFWLRVTRAGARWADPIDRPLLNYRQHPSSRSSVLREMYHDGLEVVRLHAPNVEIETRSSRFAALRILASAIVGGDNGFAQTIIAQLGSITAQEHNHLASALRWALLVHDRSRFARGELPLEEIVERIDHAVGAAVDARALAQQASLTDNAWKRIAKQALNELDQGQTLIVYGLGHNGSLVLGELLTLASDRVAWIDDAEPNPQPSAPRLKLADLDDQHIVLVTPDDREPILNRLRVAGHTRILLPEQLQRADAPIASV